MVKEGGRGKERDRWGDRVSEIRAKIGIRAMVYFTILRGRINSKKGQLVVIKNTLFGYLCRTVSIYLSLALSYRDYCELRQNLASAE